MREIFSACFLTADVLQYGRKEAIDMTDIQKMAFEAAARITAGTIDTSPTTECAEDVATYFETLYDKLLAMATSISTSSSEH